METRRRRRPLGLHWPLLLFFNAAAMFWLYLVFDELTPPGKDYVKIRLLSIGQMILAMAWTARLG